MTLNEAKKFGRWPPWRRPVPLSVTLMALTLVAPLGAACGSGADETPAATVESTSPEAAQSAPPPPAVTAAAVVGSASQPQQRAVDPSEVRDAPTVVANPVAPPQVRLDNTGMRTFPAPEVWSALRECQSGGDYTYINPSRQHFGAYQFTVATWDRLARQRYTELLDILPSDATPAEQDRMAYYLWIESGSARWPACGHVFDVDHLPPEETQTAGPAPVDSAPESAEMAPVPADAVPGPATEIVAGPPFEPSPEDEPVVPPPVTFTDATPTETTVDTVPPDELPTLDFDPSMQPAVPPNVAGFPTQAQWEALRQCESSGNYRAVSRNGLYYGAYQFWPDTWDNVAQRHYPRLIGILPSAATVADQDRMAYRLWEDRGDQPWPVCGRYLRS